MAPSAENRDLADGSTPMRNVTFAVNYEVSMVNRFMATKRRGECSGPVGFVPGSTPADPATRTTCQNVENRAPDNLSKDRNDDREERQVIFQSPQADDGKRRSAREKKRDVPLSRSRVRYDMNLVPPARRYRRFLENFPPWWLQEASRTKPPRQSQRLSALASEEKCSAPKEKSDDSLPPFSEDTSVLWIPARRSEWEDSVSEMTALCTSAAIRRHKVESAKASTKPFHAPISRDYIRDRVDIDDPLLGYQIRHKTGGWLQGFILWTNFTTWTHGFKWDSLHPMSGFSSASASSAKVDSDGSLSAELEAQARSGDPHENGIVFTTVAEIALLGGIGCGEYLLRMVLESIRSKNTFKYLVTQATDQSRTFYERFGFVRVGAVCRYGTPTEGQDMPMMGYRHWTHANESESSLQMHGGPSYMMCLKLPADMHQHSLGADASKGVRYMDQMMTLAVEHKPTIEQLGGSFTPGPKPRKNGTTTASAPEVAECPGTAKKKPGRRKRKPEVQPEAAQSLDSELRTSKRRKLNEGNGSETVVKPVSESSAPEVGEQRTPCRPSRSVRGRACSPKPHATGNSRSVIASAAVSVTRSGALNSSSDTGVLDDAKAGSLADLTRSTTSAYVVDADEPDSAPAEAPAAGETSETTPKAAPANTEPSGGKTKPTSSANILTKQPVGATKSNSGPTKKTPVKKSSKKSADTSTEKKKPRSKSKKAKYARDSNQISMSADGNRSFYSVRGPDGRFMTVSNVAPLVAVDTKFPPRPLTNIPDIKTPVKPRNGRKQAPGNKELSSTKPRTDPKSSKGNKKESKGAKPRSERESSPNDKKESLPSSPTETTSAPLNGEEQAPTKPPIDPKTGAINKNELMKQKVKSYPRSRIHYYNRVVKHKVSSPNEYFFVLNYSEDAGKMTMAPMEARGKLTGKREGRPRFQVDIQETNSNFRTVDCADYQVVKATMVMKTPVVANEAWDIEDTE